MQKNPFLKYVMKDEKEDIFHSSAYAKAQNGAGIGAASSQSYQARVNIEQNRTKVRGYGESEMVASAMSNGPRPKTYTPSVKTTSKVAGRGAMPAKSPSISIKK